MFGHVTREQALVCLQNCPLLADLAEWSHWDIVFRPALKDLKDFIQKHGGVKQCTTLGTVLNGVSSVCRYQYISSHTACCVCLLCSFYCAYYV